MKIEKTYVLETNQIWKDILCDGRKYTLCSKQTERTSYL